MTSGPRITVDVNVPPCGKPDAMPAHITLRRLPSRSTDGATGSSRRLKSRAMLPRNPSLSIYDPVLSVPSLEHLNQPLFHSPCCQSSEHLSINLQSP